VTKTAILALIVLGFVLASPSRYADEAFQFSENITRYYFHPSGAAQSFSFERRQISLPRTHSSRKAR
jgi:hypothetical protein